MSALDLSPLLYAPLVVLLSVATAVDVRTRRIPNLLSLTGVVVGLAIWFWLAGWSGLVHSFLGLVVGFIVFFPMYLLRGMGAGDVKLMSAVGAFLGPVHAFLASLIVAILGGVIAVLVAYYYGRLGDALRGTLRILSDPSAKTLDNSSKSESIPYGLAISLGVICYLLLVRYR